MVDLLEGSPIYTEELWSSDIVTEFLVTSLTNALLPRLLSLARRPVLGIPNLFHLRMMEATVFLGPFNAAEMFLVPFLRSVPRHNPVLELYRQLI